ncbi:MAG: tetratricopeptide repeat protein [Desulfobacteraceae bacterium]|nr:tetratricopeptide repeat protein [Desulfobacteraceae bacterium]
MPKDSKIITGYTKTTSVIWFVIVAFLAGFGGGVVLTVYRTSQQVTVSGAAGQKRVFIPPQKKQAIMSLVKTTKENPKDVQAWTQLGNLYFDTGQYAKAIEAYGKSLEIDDKRADVWVDLGIMFRRNENPAKAAECFDRALKIDERHYNALFNKSIVIMHDLKDQKAALESWKTLLKFHPQATTPNGKPVSELIKELN